MHSTFHCTKEVAWTSLYSTGRGGYFDGDGEGRAESPFRRNLVCLLNIAHPQLFELLTRGPRFMHVYCLSTVYLTKSSPPYHLGCVPSPTLPTVPASPCQGSPYPVLHFCSPHSTAPSCHRGLSPPVTRQLDENAGIWQKFILWAKSKII